MKRTVSYASGVAFAPNGMCVASMIYVSIAASGFAMVHAILAVVAAIALDDGTPIERILAPGNTHTYQVALKAGEFARLSVEPAMPQVRVVITSPAGEEIARRVRSNLNQYAETISFIAKASGDYQLSIDSMSAKPGRYVVRIVEHREASAADGDRIEAEALYLDGRRAMAEQRPESVRPGIALFQRSAALFRKLQDDGAVADLEDSIGSAYLYQLGEFENSLPHLLIGLALRQCLPDASARGNSLDHIGSAFLSLGQVRKAIRFYAAAVPEKNPEVLQEFGPTLRNLAMAHDQLGDEDALPTYERLLKMATEADELVGVGYMHDSMADHFFNRGQWQESLQHTQLALRAWRSANFWSGETYAAVRLGQIYQARGELERALASFRKAENIPGTSNSRSRALATWLISTVYSEMGDFDRAIAQQEKALQLSREAGDRVREADILRSLGVSHLGRHDAAAAFRYLNEALPISLTYPLVQANVLRDMSAAQLELGKLDDARRSAARALELARSVRSEPAEASALISLARIDAAAGDLKAARSETEETLRIIDVVRGEMVTPENRASFLSGLWDTYDFYIDLLMRVDRAAALQASERAHARSFVELLTESRKGTPKLDLLRALRERISARAQAQLKLAERNGADAEGVKRDLDDLNAQYEELMADIRREDPALAAASTLEPAGVPQIQHDILDASTALLEYSLGEKRSFLWVVTRDKLFTHELPPRNEVESAVRAAYQSLSTRSSKQDAVAAVSRMLLAPAAAELHARRLLVVPDGALNYLPFAALLSPESGRPLIRDHEMVTAPSASAIAAIRRNRRNRKSARKLAVFADPVFERTDSRLGPESHAVAAASRGADDDPAENAYERAARDSGLTNLPRLPFTRREATAILSLVPAAQRKEALDFNAARRSVLDPDLRNYQFIHFATHGILNSLHPELSGIVLSMVDRSGNDQDGFLTTADVLNLSLSADLVVLSGCRTGLGKEIRGEGISGLTRAFMYAGAPRVVASLWNVNDAATSELMKRFYQEMLGPKHLAPPAALRAAQLSLLKGSRWSAPYYWAGFVVQGEWR